MTQPSNAAFPVTRWSLVAGARAASHPGLKRAALEELCGLYWRPIYGFLRRRGLQVTEAQEATQEFFLSLLEEDLFAKAQAEAGRMRSFLLGALQRWQRGERRKGQTEKRGGGGHELISLDQMTDDDGFEPTGSADAIPERHFEKCCALSLLEAAMQRLAREQSAAAKAEMFQTLRPLLAPLNGVAVITHEEAARHLRLTPEALRVALHRLRRRFAEVLRETVADTLADPTDATIREEMDTLRAAFG